MELHTFSVTLGSYRLVGYISSMGTRVSMYMGDEEVRDLRRTVAFLQNAEDEPPASVSGFAANAIRTAIEAVYAKHGRAKVRACKKPIRQGRSPSILGKRSPTKKIHRPG